MKFCRRRPGIPLAVLSTLAAACSERPSYPDPPETRREVVVDELHGVRIEDPYRWLEDQDHPEVRAWIDAQNEHAERIVGDTPLRDELRASLRRLMDVDEIGTPVRGGDFEYFTLHRAGSDLPVIYRRRAPEEGERAPIVPDGEHEVVLDPHELSPGHTTRVGIESVSPDGRLLLYSVRDGGEDEIEIRLRDVEAAEDRPEVLPRALYSSVAFDHEAKGFHYSRRSRESGARVYYHELGTDVERDRLLFGEGYGPKSFINVGELAEGRYLLFHVRHGWTRGELHLLDRARGGATVPIAAGVDARFDADFHEGRLYVRTNLDAPNNRLMVVDLERPELEHWRELLPEMEDPLQEVAFLDGKIYATYSHDVSSRIRTFEMNGAPAGELDVPEHHRARIRGGEGAARLTLESYVQPPITYRVDLATGERDVWEDARVAFDPSGLVLEQVWYESKDGTSVPMYLLHREEIERDRNSRTLLHGYGGFNAAQMPRFDVRGIAWVERGGVYAVANLRGGSELGERWHRDGMLENKQNVFDDFIAAAEWLVESGYTRPERLAIHGTSNGGLLVASAFTQRPDLFRAVLCGFPDLDMVRFYTFTETNNLPALHEYGDASIPEQFAFLRAYSPYQAAAKSAAYPAVMLTSGDLDTRVPPLQARRMTAQLQHATTSGLPVILRYHPKAGHAADYGVPRSRLIEDRAMELSFLWSQLEERAR